MYSENEWYTELMTFWSAGTNCPPYEGHLISLMSRLAEDNIGHIDWSPHMTNMFQRFMISLNLPVYYKKLGVVMKTSSISTSSSVRWIIATITPNSSTLDNLDMMFNAINSYFHSTSEGKYSEKLIDFLSRLVHTFCSRLHKER